jgi:hypothetical protein
MALFFDLDVLERISAGDFNKYLAMLEFHHTKKLPKTIRSKYKPSPVSLAGRSFLLNPTPLFRDKSVDIAHKIQYIRLAARRDYLHYKLYNLRTLDTTFFPDLDFGRLRSNPLLIIDSRYINFKYESI